MRTYIWALLPLFLGGCSFTRVNNYRTTYYSTSVENRRPERAREVAAAPVAPSVNSPTIQNTPPNLPDREGKPFAKPEVNHRVILDLSQIERLKPDPRPNADLYEKINVQLKVIKEMVAANLKFWELSLKAENPPLRMKSNTYAFIVFGVLLLGYVVATASIFVLLKKLYSRFPTVQTR
ncbi:MAG: hypothetical protein ABI651_02965 [Verrucomicrobiota bacterium]